MKTNIIYACKYKLIGIDAGLPLLMEIRERFKGVNIIILFPDEYQFNKIKKNVHIWKTLKKIDSKNFIARYRKDEEGALSLFDKIKSILTMLRITGIMLFKRNIIIKQSNVIPHHSKFISFIKKLSYTNEIYAFITNHTLECHRLFQLSHRLADNKNESSNYMSDIEYDYYMSSIDQSTLKEVYNTDVSDGKFIKMGYNRKWPQWTALVNREAKKMINFHHKYFVFILSGIVGKRYPTLDEPEYNELIEESLITLKKYNPYIKTVFKPHIISDMDAFNRILRKTGYSNYEIDYSHPMILSYNAKFVMGYTFSTVFFDAYFLGKPIVLYARYDPRLFERLNGRSEGGKACDFFISGDRDKLDKILYKLVNEDIKVDRDPKFLKENFPDTENGYWEFWEDMLGENNT